MRLSFLLASTLLILNLNAERRAPVPEPDSLDDHAAVLDPIQVNGLTLIPIVARDPYAGDNILTLDEAMTVGALRVSEANPARIDTLSFANTAGDPIFLLAGEVIIGGKQDRVIAANTVIPPRATQVVPVRCVERGRWSETTGELATAGRLAHDRLRGTATYGRQVDVWEEVSRANGVHFTTNDTQTYRNLAELQPSHVRAIALRVDEALAAMPGSDRDRMIGYAVAYNGDVAAIDIFDSPRLFAKLERKLLQAYFADAVEIARAPARAPCIHALRSFIADARRGAVERAFTTAMSRTQIQRGSRAATSQVDVDGRHLYSNYLGNAHMTRPTGDRHLYPGYIGNTPRLRRTDEAQVTE